MAPNTLPRDDAAEDAANMVTLPPDNPNLAGSTAHKDKTFTVDVTNKHGYLCHTTVEAFWTVSPADVHAVMMYPDNAQLFRDLKHVGGRKIISEEPTKRVVQVEQVGEMRVMWITRKYSTWLTVTEDWTDPEHLSSSFTLLSSDVLSKFQGSWELTPVRDAKTGEVTGCKGVLHHDVLPKGVPPFLQHVPVLGGLLRGISMRAIRRLMEDINGAVAKIKAGRAQGREPNDVLQELCGTFDAANPPPPTRPPVNSFAIDDDASSQNDDARSERSSAAKGAGGSRRSSAGAHVNGLSPEDANRLAAAMAGDGASKGLQLDDGVTVQAVAATPGGAAH